MRAIGRAFFKEPTCATRTPIRSHFNNSPAIRDRRRPSTQTRWRVRLAPDFLAAFFAGFAFLALLFFAADFFAGAFFAGAFFAAPFFAADFFAAMLVSWDNEQVLAMSETLYDGAQDTMPRGARNRESVEFSHEDTPFVLATRGGNHA